jgi:1,4-dihydroxy-2-naphthoyl-CoA hydrolase
VGALTPEVIAGAAAGDAEALAAYLKAIKEDSARGVHMGTHLSIEIVEVGSSHVTMRMPWKREFRRGGGIFHGGAIMALADHVAGCLFHTDPRVAASESTGLTTDFNVSFLRAAEPGEGMSATGTVLRRGKNVTFMQIDVRGETSGLTLATCRTTYLRVPVTSFGKRKQ